MMSIGGNMDEDKTIDYESERHTLVFWNMDEYPIAVGTSDELGSVSSKMVEALRLMGFRGYIYVKVYSERPMISVSYLAPEGKYYSASIYELRDITLQIIRSTTNVEPEYNVVLISKPNREILRVLQCLKSRKHDVVVLDEECLFSSVETLLLNNARLLGGGKPRFKDMGYGSWYPDPEEEIIEDVSKMVDFSERIPAIKEDRVLIFWDAEACPFPLCSTPDDIHYSIASFLVGSDSIGKVTIWAYVDDDKNGPWKDVLMGHKTWASKIYFLPGGDKTCRRNRMIYDIHLWLKDTPRKNRRFLVTLVLVSDQFSDDPYYTDILETLSKRVFDFSFVTPTQDINQPDSPEWPALLFHLGARCFY